MEKEKVRIQKWIAQLGVASRREVERMIEAGRVKVDGKTVTELGLKIDPATATVAVDNRVLPRALAPKVYWLLYKPDKTLSVRYPDDDRRTILDLESLRGLPFPVTAAGRLDYRTEGLLIVTNDTDFAAAMGKARLSIPRHYHVLIKDRLSDEEEKAVARGITLEDGPAKRVKLQYAHGKNLGKSPGSWYFVTVDEGRNRLVRRIFEALGKEIVRLVRYGIGDLRLPEDLAPGEYRQLDSAEIESLKAYITKD